MCQSTCSTLRFHRDSLGKWWYQQKYWCTVKVTGKVLKHRWYACVFSNMFTVWQSCNFPCVFLICLFCCFCFVCVSHDEVSKPRSMQLIDLEVMSSTAEMSVLKCYHNRMQQRRGSIFNHPSRYFQLGLSTLFCFMFYFSVILFSIIPNQMTISLPYLSFYLGSIIPPLENNSENLKITFPKVVK